MIVSFHPNLSLEQTLKRSHYDSWLSLCATHCISLTRTCLPISKNANIITIKCTLNYLFCVFIYIFLSRLSSKARVERKLLNNQWWIFSLLIFFEFNLKCELVLNWANFLTAHVAFIITKRPDSTINSDLTFDILNLVMKPFTFYTFKLKFEP